MAGGGIGLYEYTHQHKRLESSSGLSRRNQVPTPGVEARTIIVILYVKTPATHNTGT